MRLNKLTIFKINEQVQFLNIKCISSEENYTNNKCVLSWQCLLCGFIFEYSKNFIDRSFKQCKNCKHNNAINKAHSIAEQKGGKCLTTIYTGSHDKIICQCKENHIFEIRYNFMVNLGYWCPECSKTKFVCEEICRVYFECLFNEKFIKIRPAFLRKDNGYILELDGYCEKLQIAFEHNGKYHYDSSDWNKDLNVVKENDKLKIELCNLNNIKLIVIPSLFSKTPLNKLLSFIKQECKKLKIVIPYPDAKIDLSKCY